MKKIFNTLAMTLLSMVAFGQTCFKDGTEWKAQINPDADPTEHYVKISRLEGTVNIGGYEALKMYTEREGRPETKYLNYYVRTDKDKVYFMPAEYNSGTWYLMYDFGMTPGQGCYMYRPPYGNQEPYRSYVKCVSIGQEEGYNYTVMELVDYMDETCDELTKGYGRWLKGVSSLNGVDFNIGFGLTGTGGGTLLEVKNGNDVYYSITSSIHENKQASVEYRVEGLRVFVSNLNTKDKIQVYQADGTLLGSYIPKGQNMSISLPKDGAYILKIGEMTKKIIATGVRK